MMQTYFFKGFGPDGREVRGDLEAISDNDAYRILAIRGVRTEWVEPGNTSSKKLSIRSLRTSTVKPAKLFRELAILTSAGLTLDQAAKALLSAATERSLKELLTRIVERLAGGINASRAFTVLDGLPHDCLALIASGERSGRMADVLATIATDLEVREQQRKALTDSLVYPAFLLTMMVGALGMITFILVPALLPIFESSNRPPPLLIWLLDSLRQNILNPITGTAAIFFLGLFVLFAALDRGRTRTVLQDIALRLPLIGKVKRQTALSRYLTSLALLMQNSVPINEALSLAADCCPIERFRRTLNLITEKVSTGVRIHVALGESGLFPPGVLTLAMVGEEVNRVPITLANAGLVMQEEAKRSAERLLAMLTPAITIVIGALVGALVISVMTALLSINELSA